jgi:5-methylcytosine-specific restriction endonuclease McrA
MNHTTTELEAVQRVDADLVDDSAQFFAPMAKLCSRCKRESPLSQFGNNSRSRDGLKYACYSCTNAASDKYRAENPLKEKAKKAKFREAHSIEIKAYNDKYMAENKKKCDDMKAAWRSANPEKAKEATRFWQSKNKSALRINNQNRRARKIANGGKLSRNIASVLFALQRGKCVSCRVILSKSGYHLDHVTALANGGSHDDKNMQLLCPHCNMSKHAKDPVDFMQSRGFLL